MSFFKFFVTGFQRRIQSCRDFFGRVFAYRFVRGKRFGAKFIRRIENEQYNGVQSVSHDDFVVFYRLFAVGYNCDFRVVR